MNPPDPPTLPRYSSQQVLGLLPKVTAVSSTYKRISHTKLHHCSTWMHSGIQRATHNTPHHNPLCPVQNTQEMQDHTQFTELIALGQGWEWFLPSILCCRVILSLQRQASIVKRSRAKQKPECPPGTFFPHQSNAGESSKEITATCTSLPAKFSDTPNFLSIYFLLQNVREGGSLLRCARLWRANMELSGVCFILLWQG